MPCNSLFMRFFLGRNTSVFTSVRLVIIGTISVRDLQLSSFCLVKIVGRRIKKGKYSTIITVTGECEKNELKKVILNCMWMINLFLFVWYR